MTRRKQKTQNNLRILRAQLDNEKMKSAKLQDLINKMGMARCLPNHQHRCIQVTAMIPEMEILMAKEPEFALRSAMNNIHRHFDTWFRQNVTHHINHPSKETEGYHERETNDGVSSD